MRARPYPDDGEALPALRIPVRLSVGETTVTIVQPKDLDALQSAVNRWMDEQTHSSPEFDPKLNLIRRQIRIMRIEPEALIGATAEAVLRSFPGQEQWHVLKWHRERNTAHVQINGDGWAGVSSYLEKINYLLKLSLLNLSGVRNFVLDPVDR